MHCHAANNMPRGHGEGVACRSLRLLVKSPDQTDYFDDLAKRPWACLRASKGGSPGHCHLHRLLTKRACMMGRYLSRYVPREGAHPPSNMGHHVVDQDRRVGVKSPFTNLRSQRAVVSARSLARESRPPDAATPMVVDGLATPCLRRAFFPTRTIATPVQTELVELPPTTPLDRVPDERRGGRMRSTGAPRARAPRGWAVADGCRDRRERHNCGGPPRAPH